MSMSDHIFWFAIDIPWETFVRLEVGGCRPLYLLVCSKNAFFCHRMLDLIKWSSYEGAGHCEGSEQ